MCFNVHNKKTDYSVQNTTVRDNTGILLWQHVSVFLYIIFSATYITKTYNQCDATVRYQYLILLLCSDGINRLFSCDHKYTSLGVESVDCCGQTPQLIAQPCNLKLPRTYSNGSVTSAVERQTWATTIALHVGKRLHEGPQDS